MTVGDLYRAARDFAAARHSGQLREGTGKPYIVHPEAVAAVFDIGTHPVEKIAAVLHDTMEDCGVTRAEIVALAGEDPGCRSLMEEVATVVGLLTHQHDLRGAPDGLRRKLYREALVRAKSNPHSRLVKIADIRDNLSSLDTLPAARRAQLAFKYSGALEFLGAEETATR